MTEEEYLCLRERLSDERKNYREAYETLVELKPRVEHAQFQLETRKIKMMKDFEQWCIENPVEIRDSNENQSCILPGGELVPLTGDQMIDSDILEFVRARRKMRPVRKM
ncbi:Kinesin- protein 6 [Cichlidogyrus casuarinus]|uniref:Kinesin- protein 6 n=1 Tax=Cichlidogyrus casuarinus TaxID=1844966 RepID=A0ABD2Q3X9_9PLAT